MNRTKFRYKPAPEPAPEFGPLSEIHVLRRAAFQSAEFPARGLLAAVPASLMYSY
jgi:hypothetical protein